MLDLLFRKVFTMWNTSIMFCCWIISHTLQMAQKVPLRPPPFLGQEEKNVECKQLDSHPTPPHSWSAIEMYTPTPAYLLHCLLPCPLAAAVCCLLLLLLFLLSLLPPCQQSWQKWNGAKELSVGLGPQRIVKCSILGFVGCFLEALAKERTFKKTLQASQNPMCQGSIFWTRTCKQPSSSEPCHLHC